MIVAAKKHGKNDPCWLLIAAHASGLYRKSTRSSDLIGLLENASSREDLLLDQFRSFLQIFETFSEIENGLLEKIKR